MFWCSRFRGAIEISTSQKLWRFDMHRVSWLSDAYVQIAYSTPGYGVSSTMILLDYSGSLSI